MSETNVYNVQGSYRLRIPFSFDCKTDGCTETIQTVTDGRQPVCPQCARTYDPEKAIIELADQFPDEDEVEDGELYSWADHDSCSGVWFERGAATITIWGKGKGGISGVKTIEEAEEFVQELADELGAEITEDIEYNNMTMKWNLDGKVALRDAFMLLDYDEMQYEPEQFPAISCKDKVTGSHIFIYSTGCVVVVDIVEPEVGEEIFNRVKKDVEEYELYIEL